MPALLLLDPYVDAILALALAFLASQIIRALFGPLYGIPVAGSAIKSAVNSITQSVTNACGHIVSGIDHHLGAALSALANLIAHAGRSFKSHAAAIAQSAFLIGTLVHAFHALKALAHGVERVIHGVPGRLRTLERDFHGLERGVKSLERDFSHGIGNDVLPRIKSLERTVTRVQNKVIPAVEDAVQAAENDVTALGEYIRANYVSVATDAITAAVAVALAAMGLSGLRCNTLLNSLKNRGCGLWGGLEDLLGLFTDLILFGSLCEAIDFLIPFVSSVAVPAVEELTQAIDVMPCVKGKQAAALTVPQLHTPDAPLSLLSGG